VPGDVVLFKVENVGNLIGREVSALTRAVELQNAKDSVGSLVLWNTGEAGPLSAGTHARIIKSDSDLTQLKVFNNRWAGEYVWIETKRLADTVPGDPKVELQVISQEMKKDEESRGSQLFSDSLQGIRGLTVLRTTASSDKDQEVRFAFVGAGKPYSPIKVSVLAEEAYERARDHFRSLETQGKNVEVQISFYEDKEALKDGATAMICVVQGKGFESLPRWDEKLILWMPGKK
jgi:hypothetical protein